MSAVRLEAPRQMGSPIDLTVLLAATGLLLFGFIMVTSASSEVAARNYGHPLYLAIKHGIFLVLGGLGLLSALVLPIRVWQRLGWALYALSIALLVLVMIPGIGHEVNGATRWIPLGFFTLQGSEFVKLFTVVFLAAYLAKPGAKFQDKLSAYLLPLGLTGILVGLLLLQPDFGACVVLMSAALAMMFFSGAPMRYFLPTLLGGGAIVVLLVVLQPYRLARLISFTDPWAHQFGGGYQLTQALIAIGRGEWFGLGLGNSVQKLFFLPEAHTDFLFSIIVEELGIVGATFVLLGFTVLVIQGLLIGKRCYQAGFTFHGNLASGIALLIGVQALINLGVNLGLLPTKGLTLPLMSFGGNSLVVTLVMIGLLLRLDWECRLAPAAPKKPGGRRAK